MLLNRIRADHVMEKNGLDVLVATTPENVAYLTGFWILTSIRHRARQVYDVLKKIEARADLIVGRGLIDHPLQGGTWVKEYYSYGEFFFAPEYESGMDEESKRLFGTLNGLNRYPDAFTALTQCLRENGVSRGRIGIDQGSDTVFLEKRLAKEFPSLETVPAYDLFREIRLIKTAEEAERIQEATRVAENALTEALTAIREGITEKQLDLVFKAAVIRQGGLPTLSCIGSGPRGAFPNVEPSEKKIEKGETIRFDVGCIYNAYHADIARTAVLGSPNLKQKRYHEALLTGQGRILENLKPGVPIGDLFQMGMQAAREKGITHYERHHLGHGTGIEGYDLPLITPKNSLKLEAGMVFCVETPYYEPGFGGLQIEDIMEVTSSGARRLTQMERKLFIV
ncbi:MAG: Xaa-Pro peptidase family protein [Deltaproteobacteria bacterium]|nr:Xaa-Pro peptidase family protein [Deltaproteobacteria bacterium]